MTEAKAGLVTTSGEAIPLQGVEVKGEILGGHAQVRVRQRYRNTESRPVEAVYTFPLPSDATLTAFSMTCDGRRVEGVVKEREAAFRQYDEAISQGHGAALLDQERPNVFTAQVGNLLPNEETIVEVEYVQRVQADEGTLRWSIPTLVAPRYIPGTPTGDRTAGGSADPTDRVPDADRITPPIGQVDYGLKMELLFDLGRPVEVESASHSLTISREGDRVRASFFHREVALDRDVVVTARGVDSGPLTTVVTHRGEKGGAGTVALTVVPDLFEATRAGPQEVVFLIDVSGSMEGASITEARAALRLCLRHLREGDRFNIIAFQSSFHSFVKGEKGMATFTQSTLESADRWVQGLDANGGTELMQPLLHGLKLSPDGVLVLLTDGQVGNEDEILRNALATRRKARVYSFGIGTNVSDALLRDLAKRTGGAVEFIHPGERIDEKVVAQFSRAVAARVTDVSLSLQGVDVGEFAPSELPPLVDGEPWVLFGRYEKPGRGTVEIRGTLRDGPFLLRVPVELPAWSERPHLPKLWAAERIRDFEVAALTGRRAEAMKERITQLAVEHQIASRYTSFVVVEQRFGDRRAHGQPETRVVPVNAPAGWDMFNQKPDAVKGGGMMPSLPGRTIPLGAPMAPPPPPAPFSPPMPVYASSRQAAVGGPPPAKPTPAPAAAPAPARSRGGVGAGAGLLGKLLSKKKEVALEEFGGGGAKDADGSASDDFAAMDKLAENEESEVARRAVASEAAMPEPLAQAPAAAFAPPQAEARSSGGPGGDPVVALLGQQLANGLWDGPGAEPEGVRRVRATVKALLSLLREGINTSHPLHGTQVKKAVEALLVEARKVVQAQPALAELALGVAWLIASGRRTRGQIEQAVSSEQTLHGLQPLLGDEGKTRKRVDELVGAL